MNEESAPAPAAAVQPLTAEKLRRRCDPAQFQFKTTRELETIDGLVGQERALDALTFGAEMRGPGFNVFVLGIPGSGKHNAVKQFLHRFLQRQRHLSWRQPLARADKQRIAENTPQLGQCVTDC